MLIVWGQWAWYYHRWMELKREHRDRNTRILNWRFKKGAKRVQWRIVIASDVGTTECTHAKKNKINLDKDIMPLPKLTPKWIIDKNVKHKATKFLEEDIAENLFDLGLFHQFLMQHQKHDPWKKLDQIYFIKIKSSRL